MDPAGGAKISRSIDKKYPSAVDLRQLTHDAFELFVFPAVTGADSVDGIAEAPGLIA